MLLDYLSQRHQTESVGGEVAQLEAAGLDGYFVAETNHDALLTAALAAEHSTRLTVGTAVAIAFARSPMSIAYSAHGLQQIARGRFVLGLGSQVRSHVERRFSMPWGDPVRRMGEFIAAYHSIWDTWETGTELRFRGDFYQHTLMPPAFSPATLPWPRPPVLLAGVGPRMTRLAGRCADGIVCHPFSSVRYLHERTLPELALAADAGRRDLTGFVVCATVLVATGSNAGELEIDIARTRRQIAFYASTPAYRPVLELHGWGDLNDEARALTRQGRWSELPDLIDDDVLNAFAVVVEVDRLGPTLAARYGGTLTRVNLATEHQFTDEQWSDLCSALHAAPDQLRPTGMENI
jgi:probable F420-dependent oxidoreductase